MKRLGFTVRIQAAEARRPEAGLSGSVNNIIAVRAGASPEAFGIVAHYDSVAGSPGAGDDGLGLAVGLEAARVLAARGERQWTLMVLFTDAEEDGLLGAAALVEDGEIRNRLKAYVNIDSTGADSPVVLFETGPGNGWLTATWARAALRPRGSSSLGEIYQRMPNDTDFSVFRRAGIPGLNLAAVGNTYAYHSPLDDTYRVSDRAIRDMGDTVVSVADALEGEDITRRTGTTLTYFDIAGVTAVTWTAMTDLALVVVAIAFALIAIARSVRDLWGRGSVRGLVWTLFWAICGTAVVFGGMVAVVAVLRGTREVYHPWYAHPGRLFLLLALAATTSGWLLFRLVALPRLRWRPPRSASAVWLPTLVVWMCLALALARAAGPAAFLCVLPLLLASAPLATGGFRRTPVITASVLAATSTVVLLLRETLLFAAFLPPLLSGAGIVTPVWVFPALVGGLAVMLAPPLLALCVAECRRRPRFVTRALIVATAAAFAWSFSAPAYTALRPLRVSVGQLTTAEDGGAHVVMSSSEPILEFGGAAPVLIPGMPDSRDLRRLVRGAFVATGRVAPTPPPATVHVTETAVGYDLALRVKVLPTQAGLSAAITLPEGVTPVRSTIPGVVSHGRWRALYVAVPVPGGFECELVVASEDASLAREGLVLVRAPGASGTTGVAASRVPADGPAVVRDYRMWFELLLR